MDGNLRYISLQYIKGDNYEEITCFKYAEIMKLLGGDDVAEAAPAVPADAAVPAAPAAPAAPADAADPAAPADTNKVKMQLKKNPLKLYFELTDTKEEEKCKIGETFLNDLVNYYNFKDIKRILIKAKKTTEEFIDEDKKNTKDIENLKIIKDKIKLFENINSVLSPSTGSVIKIIKKKMDKDSAASDDISKEKRNKIKDLLEELTKENTTPQVTDEKDISKIKEDLKNATDLKTFKLKKEELNDALFKELQQSATNLLEDLRNYDSDDSEENKENEATKLPIFKVKLNELHTRLFQDIKDKQKELDDKKEALDNLMRLYKTYIKYCKINMENYEKLFKYNEISNIDEAFMIESYSKFLKKLMKLKENLESKDTGKLKRLLVDTFNRLFNKHGIDPNKTLSKEDNEYIINLILQ